MTYFYATFETKLMKWLCHLARSNCMWKHFFIALCAWICLCDGVRFEQYTGRALGGYEQYLGRSVDGALALSHAAVYKLDQPVGNESLREAVLHIVAR